MAGPRLILLDEPSLGLAPRLVRAYVLERGRFVASGPAAALAADPRVLAVHLGSTRQPPPPSGPRSRMIE